MTALWIHGSSAHLLLTCPARWLATTHPGQAPGTGGADHPPPQAALGSAVHRAIERWFRQGGGPSPDTAMLDELLGEELPAHGVDPRLGRVKIDRRAVLRTISQLSDWAAAQPGTPEPEADLASQALRARGRADLLVRGTATASLADIKTGRPRPDQVRIQLAVYAAILQEQHTPVTAAAVYAPRHGLTPIDLHDADHLWQQLDTARDAIARDGAKTVASPDHCPYCPIRAQCPDHWAAVAAGDIDDACTGIVERIETADNGLAALLLATAEGGILISQLASVPDAIQPGDAVAILELGPQREGPPSRLGYPHTRVELLDSG